jgi:hypothetical protein
MQAKLVIMELAATASRPKGLPNKLLVSCGTTLPELLINPMSSNLLSQMLTLSVFVTVVELLLIRMCASGLNCTV